MVNMQVSDLIESLRFDLKDESKVKISDIVSYTGAVNFQLLDAYSSACILLFYVSWNGDNYCQLWLVKTYLLIVNEISNGEDLLSNLVGFKQCSVHWFLYIMFSCFLHFLYLCDSTESPNKLYSCWNKKKWNKGYLTSAYYM